MIVSVSVSISSSANAVLFLAIMQPRRVNSWHFVQKILLFISAAPLGLDCVMLCLLDLDTKGKGGW